ncbi:hypothetical protein BDU57DRAFT_511259 [Ampelomyces quisqualis]|uniref:Secreted protein n=1 Tax=Ampelomyces quisqualis TaxID=50730 RepID=A0A6A5R4J8_AMPQU|nr:hypothetical protein BDU57DRAFT_511259 [Ampelomyces quisqualis]
MWWRRWRGLSVCCTIGMVRADEMSVMLCVVWVLGRYRCTRGWFHWAGCCRVGWYGDWSMRGVFYGCRSLVSSGYVGTEASE